MADVGRDVDHLVGRGLLLDRRGLLVALAGVAVLPVLGSCATRQDQGVALVAEREVIDLATAPDLDGVVAGIRQFGLDLHGLTSDANWTASPLSITLAFGMLRAGATDMTARQLDATFGFPSNPHRALNALSAAIVGGPSRNEKEQPIEIANGLFPQQGYPINPKFIELLARQYGSDVTPVDFEQMPAALTAINEWVDQHTNGRIDRLFEQLDPLTVLVLANAVYFKSNWAQQFDPGVTRDAPFKTPTGEVSASMMSAEVAGVKYRETDDWQRVDLPYVGGELAMRLVLPREVVVGPRGLTEALRAAMAPTTADKQKLIVQLPKWDLATTIPLMDALGPLGITDLRGLDAIGPDLEVGDAIHRANVTVDETGTEAAAVTGIGVREVSAGVPVTYDRPFAWAIVHEPSGAVVFAGHVTDPSAAAA